MRAIDADAFVRKIRKQHCEDCVRRKGIKNGKMQYLYEIGGVPCRACEIEDMLNEVEDAPPIQPEPHWIPVDLENNEPPLEEWVLVSSDGYVMQDCIVERGGKKIWYHGGNIQADDRYMPLPEPYKGVTT